MTSYYDDLDTARNLGRQYAENGIAAGETEPDDSPLSGEWAGAVTVADIVKAIGADPDAVEDFEREDLADHWEAGYFSAPWPSRVAD